MKRRRCSRPQIFALLRNLAPCLVGMEACASAQEIGGTLAEMGHDSRLMPAQYAKPYVGEQKNEFADAEAVPRLRMRFVPIKTREQLELQAIHRVRDRLVGRRTSVSSQIRGLLAEHVISCARDAVAFAAACPRTWATRPVHSPRQSVTSPAASGRNAVRPMLPSKTLADSSSIWPTSSPASPGRCSRVVETIEDASAPPEIRAARP